MKIISKFKDYYDYMAYLGVDPKIVYTRHTSILKHNEFKPIPPTSIKFSTTYVPKFQSQINTERNGLVPFRLEMFHIVFCGKCYTGWIHTIGYLDKYFEVIWDLNRVKEIYVEFKSRTSKFDVYGWSVNDPLWDDLAKWVYQPANSKLLIEYPNTPVMLIFGEFYGPVILNPKLSEYSFYNKVSADQAWQELSMWLSNEQDSPETQRTERLNLLRHGMDNMSFRRQNHPSKPRNK